MSADNNYDLARRVGLLEDKDRYNDKRMRDNDKRVSKIEDQMEAYRKEINQNMDKLFAALKEIERGQYSQEITNININNALEKIDNDRKIELENKKENKRDLKQIKFIVLTAAVGFSFSFIMALIQQFFF
ncbi:DUF2951 family protein [Staphylococcus aureus]